MMRMKRTKLYPESAIAGIDVPLHAGAEKFWKEIGLTIPEPLRAK